METLKNLNVRNLRRPCAGFFLQGGVKAVAIMDIGLQLSTIAFLTVGILEVMPRWNQESEERRFARPFFWFYYYFYQIVNIVLSILLFAKAYELNFSLETEDDYLKSYQRNKNFLKQYLFINIVLYIIWIGFSFSHVLWLRGRDLSTMTLYICFMLFKLYSFWVVNCFINEIRFYGLNETLRNLTDEQIESMTLNASKKDSVGSLNKRVFEIHRERLQLWEKIGEGMQSIVYKATILPNSVVSNIKIVEDNQDEKIEKNEEKISGHGDFDFDCGVYYAAKTIDKNANGRYLKALLSELKMLIRVGNHENIVNLVGACTSKIREGEIFVIVELCPYGDLSNYLKSSRWMFLNCFQNEEILNTARDYSGKFPNGASTFDLIKWSMQTACGMEYLASKKIIHGDLAARNLLLTRNKDVKIADLGLSRQLYHYSTYIRSKDVEELLPWRMMSVESICDLHFSTQSDIWSYGITLWELFSCGGTPYPQYSFSEEFIQDLRNGMRLARPQYSNNRIYNQMKRCWNEDLGQRPTFSELRIFFENILNRQTVQNETFHNDIEYSVLEFV